MGMAITSELFFLTSMKLVEVRRVSFDYLTAGMKLTEVGGVRFDYRNTCMWLVGVRIVRFDYCKSCRTLVELWKSLFGLPQGGYEICTSWESSF